MAASPFAIELANPLCSAINAISSRKAATAKQPTSANLSYVNLTRRRASQAVFLTLGILLTGLAVTLNITWIHKNSSRLAWVIAGVILFTILIAGVVLNTIFLLREIRRNERQDHFLNAVTHELKTPIASLRLYLDTLERRTLPEEQRQKFYRTMRSDTDRLLTTVEQVLKAGELGTRRAADRTRVDLHELLLETAATVRDRHHLPPEAIQVEPVPGHVRLLAWGTPEDLRTAVLNLLDNAVKYSPNGVAITCRLSIEKYTYAIVSITDKGLGVAPTELKRIFKRFYRADTTDQVKIKGTGLGLFLVRTIARQHGGDIRAESPGPNQGTTMRLKLPLALS